MSKAAIYFCIPAVNTRRYIDNIATVTNRREVLGAEIKFDMMREIENGKKTQPHLCREFVLVIYTTQTYLLTYLLTYSMVQSPSCEANCFAASQEIPRISRNPKVHYRTHKRPPAVSILGQPNPVHIPSSHPWRSILILSTHLRLGLPSGLLPSGFPTKTLYAPLSSLIRLYDPNDLKNRTEVISAFEQNGSRIKRFRKPERSDVMKHCFSGLGKDAVPVSGPLLVVTFVRHKF